MTMKERMAILLWSEEINDAKQMADSYFEQLQDLSRAMGLKVWCNAQTNRDQLLNSSFSGRAAYLYDQYIKVNAKYDAMMSLTGKLSEVADDPRKDGNGGWIISRGSDARTEGIG